MHENPPKLNRVTPHFLERLGAALPAGGLQAPDARHLRDLRGSGNGHGAALALPGSTAEVATILRFANEAAVPVIPWGGGTGLVQGQIAPNDIGALILSLERMRAIGPVWSDEFALQAEAGATIAEIQAAAAEHGRLYPLSLASEGSATLGGALSTNAGGLNVLRYGTARELCLGVEAVLADGRIFSGLKRLRKDNTGYDLRNLLIGAEGTLGIITRATLRLFPQTAQDATALLVVPSPSAALNLLGMAFERFGNMVSGFELMSGVGLAFLDETMPDLRMPFATRPDWSVLIELGFPLAVGDPRAALLDLFAAAAQSGLASDGLIAKSEAERQAFWHLREMIPEGNRRIGSILSNDISLPLSAIPEFLTRAGATIAGLGPYRVNAFGHLGDGNLHYNVFPPKGETKAGYLNGRETLLRTINDLVVAMGGSISAEHGIGRAKAGELARLGDPTALAMMRAIKTALDPKGILNPGAILS